MAQEGVDHLSLVKPIGFEKHRTPDEVVMQRVVVAENAGTVALADEQVTYSA